MNLDFVTLAWQFINIFILIAVIVAGGICVYCGTKIMIKKARVIDSDKTDNTNNYR